VAERDQHRLEEFVNTICHEIRNPLNGLKGSLDWLIDVNNKLHELEYEGTDTHLTKEGVLNLVKEVSQQLQEAVEINQVSARNKQDSILFSSFY
jgi:signal transduction histidine kinase